MEKLILPKLKLYCGVNRLFYGANCYIAKVLLICILLFVTTLLHAQENCYETFRNEGCQNFNLMEYKAALANFEVANDCENKPKENDILTLIFNTQNCINYSKMADSLFNVKEYQVAKYFYGQVQILNNRDSSAIEKINLCDKKLLCYNNLYSLGLENYNNAKYPEAISLFKQANLCELKPDSTSTYKYIKLSENNLSLTQKADKLYNSKVNYKKAKELYSKVKNNNPFDTYSEEQIKLCNDKMLRVFMSYKYHNYGMYGLRLDLFIANRLGFYYSINLDEDKTHNNLSILFGYGLSIKIIEKGKFKMHPYIGVGNAIIGEYNSFKEENTYKGGAFYEGGLIFEFNYLYLQGGYSYSDFGNFHSPTFGIAYAMEGIFKRMNTNKK